MANKNMSVTNRALAAVVLFCLAGIASIAVHAQSRVDLELVLAVDVSQSMDLEEQRLQRNGYVAAFRHRDIIKAIASGPHGRIAVSYLEWAGDHFQSIVIPWRTIASAADANAFADELASRAISREKRTSISNALLIAASMIRQNDIDGVRKVIDVSGDGPNNSGPPVALARDRVSARQDHGQWVGIRRRALGGAFELLFGAKSRPLLRTLRHRGRGIVRNAGPREAGVHNRNSAQAAA